MGKHEQPCPNCGHCPTCGRVPWKPLPLAPYTTPWPWWWYTTAPAPFWTIEKATTGGTGTSGNLSWYSSNT